MSSTGIIRNFWEDFGIFCEMCSRVSRLNFTRESSFKGIPLDWALANVFEDLDFLSHNYCEQNKTARSEIYQRHRHLNLSLDQKLHLLTSGISQFWNKSNVICYTAFDLHEYTFMAPRQQIMMTTKSLDRMRLCFKTKVRFSDVLLVSHRIIQRQRMQNIFQFTFMLNWQQQHRMYTDYAPEWHELVMWLRSVVMERPKFKTLKRSNSPYINCSHFLARWHVGGAPTNQHTQKIKIKIIRKTNRAHFKTRSLIAR